MIKPRADFFSPPSRSFKAQLGDTELSVQTYTISGQRIFAEQASVSGDPLVTNCSRRAGKIILEGMWVTDKDPEELFSVLEEYIRENTSVALTLRKMHFPDCRIAKFTASESGTEPFVSVRLELISLAPPEIIPENDEAGESDSSE